MTTAHVDTATGEVLPDRQREQLARLAQPFPAEVVEQNQQGEDYVPHAIVAQALLYIVGPFDFQLVQTHRGDVLERHDKQFTEASKVKLRNVIVGATYRLTCEIDGRRTVVEQTGDVGNPTNWQHDGARLKDAESDALKRCASRIGLGLHLWSKGHYGLAKWLEAELARNNQDRRDDGQPTEASSARAPEGGAPSPTPPSGSTDQHDFVTDLPEITTVDQAKEYIKAQSPQWQAEFRHQSDFARDAGTLAGLEPLAMWVELIRRTWAQQGIAARMRNEAA